jgi:nucleoside-diphosphate-sugar epimerase
VLGAGGFIGSHLCRHLLHEGWAVTGVVRNLDDSHVSRRLEAIAEDIRIVVGDAADAALLERLVVDADAVFPFAGASGAAQSMQAPMGDLDANGRGQLVVLEAVRRFRPDARVVFPGSRLQYGRCELLPVEEDHPQLPTSIYGIHKLLGEQYHRLYARTYGLSTTVLRISIPYGPHQDRPGGKYGVVGTFLSQAARGEPIPLYGGGEQVRDYLFIDDLTRLIELAATHPAAIGEVFNASGMSVTSLRAMAETVVQVVGSGSVVDVPWPDVEAAVETGHYVGSFAKAMQTLDWYPGVPLEEGLRQTWAAFRTHLASAP